jgi:hypothetical protein
LCQDFGGINKVTETAPVPQGDIRAKQLRLSGHRYIHVFDFAAGFYGITVHPDSQPYITFFVEGRGYFAYQRMPFGVTGGPSEFGHVTGERFHDLIAKPSSNSSWMTEAWHQTPLRKGWKNCAHYLDRVRREKMSLSPSKLKLFMTEAVFAGAQVGPQGVSPDSSKLTAIVDWPIPRRCISPGRLLRAHQLLPRPRKRVRSSRRPATKPTTPSTNSSRHEKT